MLSESLRRRDLADAAARPRTAQGRVAAHEIMIGTPAIRNLIRENKVAQMYSSIQTGQSIGMQTLDQNLADLVRRNVISPAEARDARRQQGHVRRLSAAAHAKETAHGTRTGNQIHPRPAATLLVKQNGSDLFITAGFPPAIKVDGKITPVSKTALIAAAHDRAGAQRS